MLFDDPDATHVPSEDFTGYCHHHDRHCKLVEGSDGHVSGVCCYDWSKMGARKGWLGDSALVFLSWARERVIARERFVIVECTRSFDDEGFAALVEFFYTLTPLAFGAEDLGIPCFRKRKYMILLRKGALSWHPNIAVDVQGAFRHFSSRECGCKVMCFCAPVLTMSTDI